MVIGALLVVVFIGVIVLLGALIWFLVRTITGMQTLAKGQPIANPGSWGFTA